MLALAHDGWLYYFTNNYESSELADGGLLVARRISDGKLVAYSVASYSAFQYSVMRMLTFGERGFVFNCGLREDEFVYFPYYAGN